MIPGQYERAREVLGVSAGTYQREIREAFHRLAWEYHPDRNSDPSVQARFEEICAAYRLLTREKPPAPQDLEGPRFPCVRCRGTGYISNPYLRREDMPRLGVCFRCVGLGSLPEELRQQVEREDQPRPAEQARQTEEQRQAYERESARQEQEQERAAEHERQEPERQREEEQRQAAEQERQEQERQRAAERTRQAEELRQAYEQGRHEEKLRQAWERERHELLQQRRRTTAKRAVRGVAIVGVLVVAGTALVLSPLPRILEDRISPTPSPTATPPPQPTRAVAVPAVVPVDTPSPTMTAQPPTVTPSPPPNLATVRARLAPTIAAMATQTASRPARLSTPTPPPLQATAKAKLAAAIAAGQPTPTRIVRTPAPTPTPTATRTPTPSPTPSAPRYADRFPLSTAEIERWIIQYTNEERADEGLSALAHDARISEIARAHSEDMISLGFSHELRGHSPTDRALSAGYDCRAYHADGSHSYGLAENISRYPRVQEWTGTGAAGSRRWQPTEFYKTAQSMARAIVTSWMNSPGHRENLMGPEYWKIGVGVAAKKSIKYGWTQEEFYSTQNFSPCK